MGFWKTAVLIEVKHGDLVPCRSKLRSTRGERGRLTGVRVPVELQGTGSLMSASMNSNCDAPVATMTRAAPLLEITALIFSATWAAAAAPSSSLFCRTSTSRSEGGEGGEESVLRCSR